MLRRVADASAGAPPATASRPTLPTDATCRWTRFAAEHGMETVEAIEEGLKEKGGELYVVAGG
jgi:hypothetical protein